jgi:F-type H+-transporting ATPase subunit b
MDLLIPEVGTIFWTFIVFSISFFLLAKYAWKPVLKGLKERDHTIAEALQAAEKAKKEVTQLNKESERILAEAKAERDKILTETRGLKESMLSEARDQAKKEGQKMIDEARTAIKNERAAAIDDIKKQVADLSVAISEKILLQELSDPNRQQELIEKTLKEVRFN